MTMKQMEIDFQQYTSRIPQSPLVPYAEYQDNLVKACMLSTSVQRNQKYHFHPVFLFTDDGTIYIPAENKDMIIQKYACSKMRPLATFKRKPSKKRVDELFDCIRKTTYLRRHPLAAYYLCAIVADYTHFSKRNGAIGYYGYTEFPELEEVRPLTISFRIYDYTSKDGVPIGNIHMTDEEMTKYHDTEYTSTTMADTEDLFISKEDITEPFMTNERILQLDKLNDISSQYTVYRHMLHNCNITYGAWIHTLMNHLCTEQDMINIVNAMYHGAEIEYVSKEKIMRLTNIACDMYLRS